MNKCGLFLVIAALLHITLGRDCFPGTKPELQPGKPTVTQVNVEKVIIGWGGLITHSYCLDQFKLNINWNINGTKETTEISDIGFWRYNYTVTVLPGIEYTFNLTALQYNDKPLETLDYEPVSFKTKIEGNTKIKLKKHVRSVMSYFLNGFSLSGLISCIGVFFAVVTYCNKRKNNEHSLDDVAEMGEVGMKAIGVDEEQTKVVSTLFKKMCCCCQKKEEEEIDSEEEEEDARNHDILMRNMQERTKALRAERARIREIRLSFSEAN